MDKIDSRNQAVVAIAGALKELFSKMPLQTRLKAWRAIMGKDGQKEINNLLQHPTRPITPFRNLKEGLSFKEWFDKSN